MKRGLIITLTLAVIILATFTLFQRFQVEEKNKNVDLVFDIRQLQQLNNPKEKLSFSTLKDHNVSGIAVYEDTLQYLQEKNDLHIIKGETLKEKEVFSDIRKIYKDFSYDSNSAFLIFNGKNLSKRVKEMSSQWETLLDTKIDSTNLGESEEKLLLSSIFIITF